MPSGESTGINRKQNTTTKKSRVKEWSNIQEIWRLSAQLYIHLSFLTLMPTSHQKLSSNYDHQNKSVDNNHLSIRVTNTSLLHLTQPNETHWGRSVGNTRKTLFICCFMAHMRPLSKQRGSSSLTVTKGSLWTEDFSFLNREKVCSMFMHAQLP